MMKQVNNNSVSRFCCLFYCSEDRVIALKFWLTGQILKFFIRLRFLRRLTEPGSGISDDGRNAS